MFKPDTSCSVIFIYIYFKNELLYIIQTTIIFLLNMQLKREDQDEVSNSSVANNVNPAQLLATLTSLADDGDNDFGVGLEAR